VPVFDGDLWKLLVLGVVALIIFGPERLPAMAAQAGRALRELRKMAEGAKSELQENLGPEFSQFDLADINPKHFVRKHLLDELTGDPVVIGASLMTARRPDCEALA
jgi:sec-independent protein translocase protein TatB